MENNSNINSEIKDRVESLVISDEVLAVIASVAATEVKGVAGMVGGMVGEFAELLGKKSLAKGVKVIRDEKGFGLELSISVEYGSRIPDIAWEVQGKVKNDVESMTNIVLSYVVVSVDAINVPTTEPVKAEKKATEEE